MKLTPRLFKPFSSEERLTRRLQKQLKLDGVDGAAQRIAEIINHEVSSRELALRFVLKELKKIYREGRYRVIFTRDESPEESAAQKIIFDENSAGIQEIQEILNIFTDVLNDPDYIAELRVKVIGHVIRKWRIGLFTMEEAMH